MQGLGLFPTRRRILGLGWVVLLAVASTAPALAQTMLTNGSELFVRLPIIPDTSQRIDALVTGADGYTIFVPPGATGLRVEFRTDPGTPIELLLQHGSRVGSKGLGNRVADFRTFLDARGIGTIEVNNRLRETLKTGTYFIGFFVNQPEVQFSGILVATVEGVDPLFVVAESKFDKDLDGWTRNDTASSIPGTNVGHQGASLSYQATGGNPDGHARYRTIFQGPNEWFVAPAKFHVNLLELDDLRFEFDLARFTGDSASNFNVEVRVFSANGGYSWSGQPPPPIPTEVDFFTQQVEPIWQRVSVPIRDDVWRRVGGTDFFQVVFSEVARIEVRATYALGGGSVGLDNFRLLGRGTAPVRPVLPTLTSFSGGLDRWTSNNRPVQGIAGATTGDSNSTLFWNSFEGNPGGHARLVENGGSNPDAFVAPLDYLGDYSQLSGPRFEFDYRHKSESGATKAVKIRLISEEGVVFEWSGVVPGDIWGRQVAPLSADAWTPTAGSVSFEDAIRNVVRIEVSADQASGPEWNSLDNFSLLTDDSPPVLPTLTANPPELNLSGAATGPNPDQETIQVTSSAEALQWQATVTGDLADRVQLSATSGQTPSEITLEVNTQGLEAGEYEAEIAFEAVGITISPSVVTVELNLDPQPVPTPVISRGGVVNAATNQQLLAPGSLGTVYGTNLGGPARGLSTSFGGRTGDLLPTSVNGLRVEIYSAFGGFLGNAPLLYLGQGQINFQMPFEVMGQTSVQVVVNNNGAASAPEAVLILGTAPGVFTFGNNRALALNPDGTLNSPDNPLARRKVLAVFMTGQGLVAPEWPTGKAASTFPLIHAPSDARALVGGVQAKINFLGLAPGLVGVLQLNVAPVWETPLGNQPLLVTIGGVTSNVAVVSIR